MIKKRFRFFDLCVHVILVIKEINLMEQVVNSFYGVEHSNI